MEVRSNNQTQNNIDDLKIAFPDWLESKNDELDELSSFEIIDNGFHYQGFGDNRISTQEIRNDGLSSSAYDNDNLLVQTPQSLEKNPFMTPSSTADQIKREDGRTKK